MSTASASGLSADFPFTGSTPALVRMAMGFSLEPGMTSLVRQTARQPHPVYGNGMLQILQLPERWPAEDVPVLAKGLNRVEASPGLTAMVAGHDWMRSLWASERLANMDGYTEPGSGAGPSSVAAAGSRRALTTREDSPASERADQDPAAQMLEGGQAFFDIAPRWVTRL